jgi:uncharacterized membrane protein YfcA
MLPWVQTVLFIFILVMLVCSVYYSFRYRREKEPKQRGLLAARMNICMGIMLVAIAITQIFFFSESSLRRIFGTVCVLIGLYNFFVGVRNHSHFQRLDR